MAKQRHAERRHAIRAFVGDDPNAKLMRMGIDASSLSNLWEAGPVDLCISEFAERAGAPVVDVRQWKCPCCPGVKALYATGDNGMFFRLMVSTQQAEMSLLCKFESVDDLDGLAETWPDEHDRELLEVYMAMGLYEALREMFVA
jgi:hypothetical protein